MARNSNAESTTITSSLIYRIHFSSAQPVFNQITDELSLSSFVTQHRQPTPSGTCIDDDHARLFGCKFARPQGRV